MGGHYYVTDNDDYNKKFYARLCHLALQLSLNADKYGCPETMHSTSHTRRELSVHPGLNTIVAGNVLASGHSPVNNGEKWIQDTLLDPYMCSMAEMGMGKRRERNA